MANNVRITTSVDDGISSPLEKIRDKFDEMGKGAASASLIGNAGAKVLEAGMNLVGDAVGRATEFIGNSIEAYRTEEKSIAGLTAALDANVPAWDAHNNAIETTIASREKLGFADDAQREALKILLAATNDSTSALEAQAVAMDLARFRGIDLSTASDLVAKAWNGNTTSLKKLGIEVAAGTSGMAALAAITKVTGGQAQKFADTDLGKAEAAAVSVDDSMEKVGATFSHLSAAILPAAAKAFDDVVESMTHAGLQSRLTKDQYDALSEKLKTGPNVFGQLGDAVGWLADQYAKTHTAEADLNAALDAAAPKIAEAKAAHEKWAAAVTDSSNALEDGRNRVHTATAGISGDMKVGFIDSSLSVKLAVVDAMEGVGDAVEHARDRLKNATDSIINDSWDPLINAAEIKANKLELAAAQEELATKNLTASERAQLELRILNLQKHQDQLLAEQAKYGDTSSQLAYTQGKYTKEQMLAGLQSKDPEVRKHWEELLKAEADAQDALATQAYAAGSTAGGNYATGLGSGMDANWNAWHDPADRISAVLTGYSPSGYPIGAAWVNSIADGIQAGDSHLAGVISQVVGSKMIGFSPPKAGPLRFIDKGGANIATAWSKAFIGGIDEDGINQALAGISGLMASGNTAAGLSSAAGAIGGSSAGALSLPPIYVYIDGREARASNARWARLSDGRSQYTPA